MGIAYDELPAGDLFTGTTTDVRPGDYVKCSVHGYSLVMRVQGSTLHFASGGSESGYPYGRPILRPAVNLIKAYAAVTWYDRAAMSWLNRAYPDAVPLVANGWTMDSALNHVQGMCDILLCTHPSHHEEDFDIQENR